MFMPLVQIGTMGFRLVVVVVGEEWCGLLKNPVLPGLVIGLL